VVLITRAAAGSAADTFQVGCVSAGTNFTARMASRRSHELLTLDGESPFGQRGGL